MASYHLGPPENLAKQLKVMHSKMPKEAQAAMRRAARGSVSAIVIRATSGSRPPVDTGQFLRSFTVKDVKDGAELYSSEAYASVIEIGRRPGKAPPREAIREWLLRKRLVPKPPRKKKSKKAPEQPKPDESGKGKKVEANAKRRTKKLQIHRVGDDNVEGVVRAVVMKIAKKGIEGRFPMRKALPDMRKILARELDVALRRAGKPSI